MKAIAKKLVQVMADCAYVQKSGTNDFHRYKYATAADVLEKVNASLVKHGVAVTAQAEVSRARAQQGDAWEPRTVLFKGKHVRPPLQRPSGERPAISP